MRFYLATNRYYLKDKDGFKRLFACYFKQIYGPMSILNSWSTFLRP